MSTLDQFAAAPAPWSALKEQYEHMARPSDFQALLILGLIAVGLAWLLRARRR